MILPTAERRTTVLDASTKHELSPWVVGYAALAAFFFMGLYTFCCMTL